MSSFCWTFKETCIFGRLFLCICVPVRFFWASCGQMGSDIIQHETYWKRVQQRPHKLISARPCLSDGLVFPLISVATHIWSVCRYQLLSDTMFNNFQAVIVSCWKPRIFSHNTLTEMYNTDVSPPPPHSSDSKFSIYFMLHLLLPLIFISVSTGLLLFFNEIWKCLTVSVCPSFVHLRLWSCRFVTT